MRFPSLRHGVVPALALPVLVGLLMAGCASTATPTEMPATPTQEVAVATVPPPTAPPTSAEADPTATDTPEPTQEIPSDTPEPATETPTNTPEPATATPEPTETPVAVTFGQTGDGLYFRGNPDASVTVIDYSDFL
jgi:outer membrane biosynthesis protein TonB